MLEKDSLMILDSEAELVGDQSELVSHKIKIKLLQEIAFHTTETIKISEVKLIKDNQDLLK